MLITIASNSDNDANQFVNYFPEGLIIPKNSKIGVVNCSYVLHEGYIVDGTNNEFQLQLANMATYGTVQVAQGVYQTATALATAIQTALHTFIGSQSAIVQSSFPLASQTVSANAQGNQITIHLTFDSAGTALDALNTTGTVNTFIKDVAKAAGDQGQYVNLTNLPSNNDNYMCTGDGAGNHFWLASLSKIGQNFYAIAECRPQAVDVQQDFFLVHREDLAKQNSPIRIVINSNGKLLIYELINGVQTHINMGTAPDITPNATIQIRLPAIDSSSTQAHHAEYFLTTGGNEVEVAVDATGGRYNILPSDEFLIKYEFEGGSSLGVLPSQGDDPALNDALLEFTYNAGGNGYVPGDILTQSGSTGAGIGIKMIVTAVSPIGEVNQAVINSTGEGHAPGDTISFTGGFGDNGFKIDIVSVQDNYAVTNLGATYATGTGVALTGGSGTGATCAITSVDGAGGITGLTITDAGEDYVANDTLTVSGGDGNAQVTIGAVINNLVVVKGLKANLVENPPNQRPLVLYDTINANMYTLSLLINTKDRYRERGTADISSLADMITNNRNASNLHIQLDSLGGGIESREVGVNGKTVAVVPLGDNSNSHTGLFNNELFNIIYHNLKNPEPLMNNELSVRLTDYKNNLLPSLFHPVTITFDIRPELK